MLFNLGYVKYVCREIRLTTLKSCELSHKLGSMQSPQSLSATWSQQLSYFIFLLLITGKNCQFHSLMLFLLFTRMSKHGMSKDGWKKLHTVKYSFHFDWPFSGRSMFLSDQCTCTFLLVTYKVYKRMIFRYFFLLLKLWSFKRGSESIWIKTKCSYIHTTLRFWNLFLWTLP